MGIFGRDWIYLLLIIGLSFLLVFPIRGFVILRVDNVIELQSVSSWEPGENLCEIGSCLIWAVAGFCRGNTKKFDFYV